MKIFFVTLMLLVSCSSKQAPKKAPAFAKAPLESSCETGNSDACVAMGSSEENKPNLEEASKWFVKACDLKNVEGCLRSGAISLESGKITDAKKRFEQGCSLQDKSSCYGVGIISSGIYGGEEDLNSAKDFFSQSCELGLNDGCAQSAMSQLKLASTLETKEEALTKLQAICVNEQNPSSMACYNLGEHYLASEPPESLRWFTKACKIGDGSACLATGFAYLEGKGVKKSIEESHLYFEKGCLAKEKDWVACSLSGYANYKNAQSEDEKTKAKKMLESTCVHEAEGCFRMSLIESDVKWIEKACLMNEERCDVYRRYRLRQQDSK